MAVYFNKHGYDMAYVYFCCQSLPPNIYLVPHLYCSIVGALFENPFGISLELCSMKHNVLIYSVVTECWMNLLNGEQLDSDLLSDNLQVNLNMK